VAELFQLVNTVKPGMVSPDMEDWNLRFYWSSDDIRTRRTNRHWGATGRRHAYTQM